MGQDNANKTQTASHHLRDRLKLGRRREKHTRTRTRATVAIRRMELKVLKAVKNELASLRGLAGSGTHFCSKANIVHDTQTRIATEQAISRERASQKSNVLPNQQLDTAFLHDLENSLLVVQAAATAASK
jgi:hypothetical protein